MYKKNTGNNWHWDLFEKIVSANIPNIDIIEVEDKYIFFQLQRENINTVIPAMEYFLKSIEPEFLKLVFYQPKSLMEIIKNKITIKVFLNIITSDNYLYDRDFLNKIKLIYECN
jgi:hypothetical protein